MDYKKIILVEDDRMLCTIFDMFLREMGHELLGTFLNGATAIEKCKEIKPDLVLMDIHIQGQIDGIEAAAIIQKQYHVPVVFLSSDTDEETVKKAVETNSFGFLVKPVNRTTLSIAIELACFKHQYESNLKNREIRYRELIDISEDAVIIFTDGIIEFVNGSALRLLEAETLDQIVGRNIHEFIDEESAKLFTDKINFVLRHQIKIEYFIATFKSCKGNPVRGGIVGSVMQFDQKHTVQLITKTPTHV